MLKQGKDRKKIDRIVTLLLKGEILPAAYNEHKLSGTWKGYIECHIEPDWLLVYKFKGDELQLVRTGSHSDIF